MGGARGNGSNLSRSPMLKRRRRRGHDADRGRRFAVVWAIWLHRNEVVFERKAVSSEGIIHEVERFVGAWFLHM